MSASSLTTSPSTRPTVRPQTYARLLPSLTWCARSVADAGCLAPPCPHRVPSALPLLSPPLFPLQGRRSQRSVPSASRRSTLARGAGRLTPGQVFQASRRSRASLRPLSSRLPCPGPGPAGAQSLDRVHTRRRAFVKRGRYDLTIRRAHSWTARWLDLRSGFHLSSPGRGRLARAR